MFKKILAPIDLTGEGLTRRAIDVALELAIFCDTSTRREIDSWRLDLHAYNG